MGPSSADFAAAFGDEGKQMEEPSSAASADEETRREAPSSAGFVVAFASEGKRREVPSLAACGEGKRGLEP